MGLDYTPGTFVKVPGSDAAAAGQLLVRVQVNNDYNFEDRETLTLALSNGSSTGLSGLQYFDGSTWQTYTAGPAALDARGQLLLRVALGPELDAALDTGETFMVQATNTGGTSATGTGTLCDDGTGAVFGAANTSGVPDVLGVSTDPTVPRRLDDDRVAGTAPKVADSVPALVAAPRAPVPPALHVQWAVAESRQAASPAAPDSTAGVVTARASSGVGEATNALHRADLLIDRLDPTMDPHLYVLPEVRTLRSQSFDAGLPSLTLQSGLLASGSLLDDLQTQQRSSTPSGAQAPTLADLTLVSLVEPEPPVHPVEAAHPRHEDRDMSRRLNAHLAAVREAGLLAQSEGSAPTRGQWGFSRQLKWARQSLAQVRGIPR